jgi:hypothetical protein
MTGGKLGSRSRRNNFVWVDEASIHNEHDASRHWNLMRDTDHVWVIFVKKAWTKDVSDNVAALVIFS